MSEAEFELEPDPVPPPPPPPSPEVLSREDLRDRYRDVILGLLPPGKIFARLVDDATSRFARGLAGGLADAALELEAFRARVLPHQMIDPDLAAWEATLELPSTGTLEERQERVAAKMTESMGHAMPDLLAVAASFGVTSDEITVVRYTPFYAGRSRAGDRLTNRYWANTVLFVITAPRNEGLEEAFDKRRRAHATFLFTYPTGVQVELEQGGALELEQGDPLQLEQA